MLNKLLIFSWVLALVFLFLYSFTQVDLGLTLNRSSVITDVQRSFQYIGYFNRPLSALLAMSLFILFFLLYCMTLRFVWKHAVEIKTAWIIIFAAAGILLFSYNAFSYDLFNYMFDARIVTEYGQNPYLTKALDFPRDPYLGFMHWTHRTYPYGPLWLGVTIPISFLGSQVFIITFYLFKLLMVLFYLGCCYFIYKIADKTKLVNPAFALVFFGLNPLVIIESLVSSHHDLVMMLPALVSVYLLLQKKYVPTFVFLALSIGVKFATGFLVPLFIWYSFSKDKNKIFYLLLGSTLLMIGSVVLASFRTTFQPWYLLFVLPFASLISHKYYVSIFTILVSFLVLFQYIPFLFTGNFDSPIPQLMNEMLTASIFSSVVITIGARMLIAAHKK